VQATISQTKPLQVLWFPNIGTPLISLPPSIGLLRKLKTLKVLAKGGIALAIKAGIKKYMQDNKYRKVMV
jgi:hypothetical protein